MFLQMIRYSRLGYKKVTNEDIIEGTTPNSEKLKKALEDEMEAVSTVAVTTKSKI